MARRRERPEVVYVERAGDSSAKWLFWGAVLGAGLALLYAPRTGEETRRSLQRRLWKLRAMAEEKLDELAQQFNLGRREALRDLDEEPGEREDEASGTFGGRGAAPTARQELERRLAEARARRRSSNAAELEEPLS